MEFTNATTLEEMSSLPPEEKSNLRAKFGEGVRLGMQNFDEHDGVCIERYVIITGKQVQGSYHRRIYGTSPDRILVETSIRPQEQPRQSA